MRAARVTRLDGPDAIEVAEVDEPTGDGVVVEVHAAGAAFPDALLTRGLYQYRPEPPFVLGAEIAGVVRSAPDDAHVTARRPGRRTDHADRRDGRGRAPAARPGVQAAGQRELRGGRRPAVQRPDRVLRADGPRPAAAGRDGAGARRGRRDRNVDAAAGIGARGVPHHRGSQHRGEGARSRRRPAPPTWCWPTASRTRSRS